jgi:DNA-binding transcriptional LysR family regulator
MDIEILKTFMMVRELGHFGKTAKNFGVTQSAVSLRIKQLEDELGAPLFNRYRNNLQLTTAGERLVLYAEKIISEWEKAKIDITMRQQTRRIVRFGASNGFCSILLKNNIGPIYQNVDNIILKATTMVEDNVRRNLREKGLDIAIMYEPMRDTMFTSVPFSSVELVLVSSQQNLTVEDMLKGKYVSVEWGSFFNTQFLEMSSMMSQPVIMASDCDFALQFILDHGGSAYLPYSLVKEHLGKSLFRIDEAPVLDQPIYAIFPTASVLKNEITGMIQVLKENSGPMLSTMEDVLGGSSPKENSPALAAV